MLRSLQNLKMNALCFVLLGNYYITFSNKSSFYAVSPSYLIIQSKYKVKVPVLTLIFKSSLCIVLYLSRYIIHFQHMKFDITCFHCMYVRVCVCGYGCGCGCLLVLYVCICVCVCVYIYNVHYIMCVCVYVCMYRRRMWARISRGR